MIQEAYCSKEVSKLLKEKGFDEELSMVYTSYSDLCKCYRYDSIRNSNYNDITKNYFECTAPTHQMAMAWLREVHNIFIVIEPYSNTSCYFSLWEGDNYYENPLRKGFPSYEETVEQALKYCLKKIIK